MNAHSVPSPKHLSEPCELQTMPSPYGPIPADGLHRGTQLAELLCGNGEQRHEMIAQAAYFRAKHRGFAPGHELEDWAAAEAEVDRELALCLPL